MGNINVSDVEKALNDARATLDRIYSLDVLPVKYRSINAVATLYEYLENGVCTTVQGHGGIYDTYEYHIQIGRIIAKLDVIISKLDQIQQSQTLLYETITESNQTLNKMSRDIEAGNKMFAQYSAASLMYQQQQTAALNWNNWNTWHNS